MNIVPRVRTPVPLYLLPGMIDRAYHSIVGTCPGVDITALLMAMLCQEHGRRDDSLWAVWCYNLGNIDATEEEIAWGFHVFSTSPECEGGDCGSKAVHVRRAWIMGNDGVFGWLLSLKDRYPASFLALGLGARPFVEALKAEGYFTGDVEVYANGVELLVPEMVTWVESDR